MRASWSIDKVGGRGGGGALFEFPVSCRASVHKGGGGGNLIHPISHIGSIAHGPVPKLTCTPHWQQRCCPLAYVGASRGWAGGLHVKARGFRITECDPPVIWSLHQRRRITALGTRTLPPPPPNVSPPPHRLGGTIMK